MWSIHQEAKPRSIYIYIFTHSINILYSGIFPRGLNCHKFCDSYRISRQYQLTTAPANTHLADKVHTYCKLYRNVSVCVGLHDTNNEEWFQNSSHKHSWKSSEVICTEPYLIGSLNWSGIIFCISVSYSSSV